MHGYDGGICTVGPWIMVDQLVLWGSHDMTARRCVNEIEHGSRICNALPCVATLQVQNIIGMTAGTLCDPAWTVSGRTDLNVAFARGASTASNASASSSLGASNFPGLNLACTQQQTRLLSTMDVG